ncbi:hypothetical protein ACIBEA_16400 [Streptomyces sp. NPDC051555]|uniref:hypothetical protein n=1 Tax=Streptomyces sp. NPDC051555 TaxID=3365657 RepID=UPI0037B526A0
MGILMAVVPCTAEHAELIVTKAARTAGATPAQAAAAVTATCTGDTAVPPVLERALRTEMDAARRPPTYPANLLLPPAAIPRQHLTHRGPPAGAP